MAICSLLAIPLGAGAAPKRPGPGPAPAIFTTSLTQGATITTPYVWTFDPGTATTAGYFWADGTLLAKISGPGPYTFTIKAGTLADGTHQLGHAWDTTTGAHQTPSSSYSVTVQNPSTSTADTTPPSAPTGLTVSNVSATGATLGWSASTDNVGVTGYKLYLNGSQAGTTSSLSYAFTGLSCGTTYTLAAAAYDAAGNTSTQASIQKATAACAATNFGTALPTRLAASSGSTYYVDGVSGSDSNAGTQSAPWRTIDHAVAAVAGQSGPTIYLRGSGVTIVDGSGQNSSNQTPFRGSGNGYTYLTASFPAGAPLTISNYPGERVLINSDLYGNWQTKNVRILGKAVNGKPGLVIDGLNPVDQSTYDPAGWAADEGIKLIGSQNVEISGVEIRNQVAQGIYVGSGSFSAGAYGAQNVQIIGNYIHHNGCYTCPPNDPTRADAPLGHDHGIYYGGVGSGVVPGALGGAIYNNIIVHNFDFNITLHNAPKSTIVSNNTLSGWGDRYGKTDFTPWWSTSSVPYYPADLEIDASALGEYPVNVMMANNIAANNWYGLRYYWTDSSQPTGNVEQSNLYFGSQVAYRSSPQISSALQYLSTLLGVDPLFTNPAGDDYHLQAGSPATGAGLAQYTPPTDYYGNPRTTADLGAIGH